MKLINIVEARSNPAQNPKQNIYNELSKYAGRKDIFVTFSSVNKMGIFPSSSYNTPVGFYTYPVDFILKQLSYTNLGMSRPFPSQADTKYVIVSQLVDLTGIYDVTTKLSPKMIKFIDNDPAFQNMPTTYKLTTYGSLWKLIYLSLISDNFDLTFKEAKETLETIQDNDDGDDEIIDNIGRTVTKVFRRLGINGITDLKGKGIIHNNEPTQAVFFNMRNLKHIDTLLDNNDQHEISVPEMITNDTSPKEILSILNRLSDRRAPVGSNKPGPDKDISAVMALLGMPYNDDTNPEIKPGQTTLSLASKYMNALLNWFRSNFTKQCFREPGLVDIPSTPNGTVGFKIEQIQVQAILSLNDNELAQFMHKCIHHVQYELFVDRMLKNLIFARFKFPDDFVLTDATIPQAIKMINSSRNR